MAKYELKWIINSCQPKQTNHFTIRVMLLCICIIRKIGIEKAPQNSVKIKIFCLNGECHFMLLLDGKS